MFTDLKINTDLPKVPAQGFYVTLEWMFGDADGDVERTFGPIPHDRRDLVLELANLLEDMVVLYEDSGKGGYDGYEDVNNYNLWFESKKSDDKDQQIRNNVGCEIEYTPDGSGCVAELTGYNVTYQNGITAGAYDVTLS